VRVAPWSVGVVAVTSAACHWTVTPDDAGTTDSGSQTVGDQCVQIATEYCLQYGRCNVSVPLADCTASFQPQCCVGSACTNTATVAAATVDSCKSELDTLDCNLVVNLEFPSDCTSVLTQ
jgi:hypothetical protein